MSNFQIEEKQINDLKLMFSLKHFSINFTLKVFLEWPNINQYVKVTIDIIG